jgi:site-specific DNA recombinase
MVSAVGIMFTNTFCNGRWNKTQTHRRRRLTPRRKIMEIAIYVRVSTPRQQQQQTIEQQLERLRAYIAQHPDWQLAPENIFRDDGYSGAKLHRPGLDRLRDRAALAAFSLVLITAPDRLARKYVHQVLLLEELTGRSCQVEFVDRPMSDDPHDQLVLQIRGAVAEYERGLIGDRMRRGRLARLRAGQLLPWTVPLYGYQLDAERPRDPARVRLDPVTSVIVQQIFTWYTESQPPLTLYQVASRLTEAHIPTPSGRAVWNVATVRGILRNPAYTGTAYSERWQMCPAQQRKSALQPIGRGESQRPAPPEDWIGVSVPALISQELFAAAQTRLDYNKKMAARHNNAHQYLLRGLVSCGRCQHTCIARCAHPGYGYYLCRDKTDARRASPAERCQTRYAPAAALDELVWQDLCQLLTDPALITQALQRAQAGEWLPQALQAQRQNLSKTLKHLERQQARLLDLYLAETIDRAEFERKRQELTQTQTGLEQQFKELEAQARKQMDLAGLATGIEAFCLRLQPTLQQLTFAQRRQLVELLVDRVIINDGQVEVRYVIPTGPAGEKVRFCHLRKDYFDLKAALIHAQDFEGLALQVGRCKDRVVAFAVYCVPHQHYHTQPALERAVIQLGGIGCYAWLCLKGSKVYLVKAAQVLPSDFTVVSLRASLFAGARPRVTEAHIRVVT